MAVQLHNRGLRGCCPLCCPAALRGITHEMGCWVNGQLAIEHALTWCVTVMSGLVRAAENRWPSGREEAVLPCKPDEMVLPSTVWRQHVLLLPLPGTSGAAHEAITAWGLL